VGKPEGKRPLGRPRSRWVNHVKIYLRETGWDGMAWVNLTEDRDQWRVLVNMLMNLRVPQNVNRFLGSNKTGCFSKRAQLH
jgi:hypothetical protein